MELKQAASNPDESSSEPATNPFKLLDDGSGIEISGWTITSSERPIANTAAEERLADELNIKLPSMLFDQSKLCLTFNPSSSDNRTSQSDSQTSQPSNSNQQGIDNCFQLSFDAVSALHMVGTADPQIKVKAAARWTSKKKRSDVEITTIDHASDWTFSTKYKGTMTNLKIKRSNQSNSTLTTTNNTLNDDNQIKYRMDYDALRDTTLPILFSSQVILFEDELDDNGTASYKVRIRVMPTFFFILARFFLRVDSVLVRIYETRYFHRFGLPAIVCETVHREASIPTSLQHLHVSVLRDADLLAPKVPVTSSSLENIFI